MYDFLRRGPRCVLSQRVCQQQPRESVQGLDASAKSFACNVSGSGLRDNPGMYKSHWLLTELVFCDAMKGNSCVWLLKNMRCRPLHRWWATPHGEVDGQCITTIMSVATAHGDVDGLLHACAPSFRWSTPRRDVDGLCLAVSISMGYTSPGCRRVMPRLTSGWPKVATHRVQMTTPPLFGVGAKGGHIGSK